MTIIDKRLPARISAKIVLRDAPVDRPVVGPCWIWMGARFEKRGGYGATFYNGKVLSAHRLTYTLLVGPIGDDLELDHLCRVHPCCNPLHLEPVAHSENLSRGLVGYRKAICTHGHAMVGDNIFKRRRGHLIIWECRTCINDGKRRRRRAIRVNHTGRRAPVMTGQSSKSRVGLPASPACASTDLRLPTKGSAPALSMVAGEVSPSVNPSSAAIPNWGSP